MKKLLGLIACTCLSAVLVFGTTGCPDKKDKKVTEKKVTVTKTDKEKKTTTTDEKTKTVVDKTGKYTVKSPADVSVTQGETATVTVDITRDKFADPVDVKFAGLPDGVSVPEKDWTIAKDATSTKFTLKAAADAKPVVDQKVTVTAKSGTTTHEATFKVTVKKKAVEKKADEKKVDEKKVDEKKVDEKKADEKKKVDEKKKTTTEEKKTGSLSTGVINFYAQLNERFLTPFFAIRSLDVPVAARRNEQHVTG